MKRRTLAVRMAATGISLARGAVGLAQETTRTGTSEVGDEEMRRTAVETGYAPVNGLEMY